jgi:hypothetical protein
MLRAMLVLCLPLVAFAADVNGRRNLHLVRFGEIAASARVELKTEGTRVTGTLNELKLDGTFEGDRLRLTATRPDGATWGSFNGRLQGDGRTDVAQTSSARRRTAASCAAVKGFCK